MPNVVHSYWAGALRRLQAEVDGLAKLVKHTGEQGRENELALARVLTSLIPGRFGTGSGLLIDNKDTQSAQVDVVVFEQTMEAALFAQTTQLLFPIEAVYAVIEVKTTLSADDVTEFDEKTKKLNRLTPARSHLDESDRPLNCLFAYSAWATPQTVMKHIKDLNAARRPDLGCVVDQGFVFGNPQVLGWDADDPYMGGVTFLHDGDGELIAATEKKIQYVDGLSYAVMRLGKGHSALIDAPRGLLLFLEALLRNIHKKADEKETILTLYLDDALKKVQPIA